MRENGTGRQRIHDTGGTRCDSFGPARGPQSKTPALGNAGVSGGGFDRNSAGCDDSDGFGISEEPSQQHHAGKSHHCPGRNAPAAFLNGIAHLNPASCCPGTAGVGRRPARVAEFLGVSAQRCKGEKGQNKADATSLLWTKDCNHMIKLSKFENAILTKS